jgi:hypothetical protein
MRKVRRRRRGYDYRPAESGDLLRQVGQYENANGWPVGPVGIAMAVVVVAIAYPITRFVRFMTRR